MARQLGWAKTYDAEYVVLARSTWCAKLTTMDAKLSRSQSGPPSSLIGSVDCSIKPDPRQVGRKFARVLSTSDKVSYVCTGG